MNYRWSSKSRINLVKNLLFTNICKVVLIYIKKNPNPTEINQPVSDLIVFLVLVLKLTLWTGLKEENPQMLFKNTRSKIIDAAYFYEVHKRNLCIDFFPGGYPSVCSVSNVPMYSSHTHNFNVILLWRWALNFSCSIFGSVLVSLANYKDSVIHFCSRNS